MWLTSRRCWQRRADGSHDGDGWTAHWLKRGSRCGEDGAEQGVSEEDPAADGSREARSARRKCSRVTLLDGTTESEMNAITLAARLYLHMMRRI